MSIFAIIKTQFEAIHSWDNCNIEDVMFLKNKHHHIFRVEVKIPQKHDDRDIEYLDTKHHIDYYLQEYLKNKNMSCEQYADNIKQLVEKHFNRDGVSVGVYEDNGCGAIVD